MSEKDNFRTEKSKGTVSPISSFRCPGFKLSKRYIKILHVKSLGSKAANQCLPQQCTAQFKFGTQNFPFKFTQ